MKLFICTLLTCLASCIPGPSRYLNDMTYPVRVLSVSHFTHEDVGFNGTKFTAATLTTVLFLDSKGKMFEIEESGSLDFVKDQMILTPTVSKETP
jgi:hypothetical protein